MVKWEKSGYIPPRTGILLTKVQFCGKTMVMKYNEKKSEVQYGN